MKIVQINYENCTDNMKIVQTSMKIVQNAQI
jgi:hypothetical protein